MPKTVAVWSVVLCVLLGNGCFGPFDPTNPPPARNYDPDNPNDPTDTGTGNPTNTPGLLAWWTCDETSTSELVDSLGKYNGTIAGCSRDTGIEGAALEFHGSGSSVKVYPPPNDSSFDFKTGDFTISMWVKPMVVGGAEDTMNIVARGSIEGRDGFVLTIIQNRYTIYFGEQKKEMLGEDGPVEYGVFQHIVLTRRTGAVKLFVDAKEVIALNSTESIQFEQSIPLVIGNDNTNKSDCSFNGLIDEIKLLDISWDAATVGNEYRRFRN